MPERAVHKIDKGFNSEVVRKASSSAYNDQFLTDIATPPSTEVSSGSSNIEDALQSQKQKLFRDSIRVAVIHTGGSVTFHPWPKLENPLTQSDSIENEEKEVQELIYSVKISSIRNREKLANRLDTLFRDSKEEDPDGIGISADSLRNFIKLLHLHPNLKQPSISLAPEYNIYISWRDKPDRVFSVHFLPNGDARFVVFRPNYKHPERKIRNSGLTTTDILMETVSFYNVSDWVSE